jgi:hypothetical protein
MAGLMSARSYDDFQTYLADCGVSSGGNGPGPSLAKAAVRLFRTQPVAGVEKILRQVTGRAVELRSVLPVRRVATETGYAYAMHWAHARLSSRLAATDRAFLEASA